MMYRNYVEKKQPITKSSGDDGIRPPSEDSHLGYLAKIQDQLNAQTKVEPDPILSVIPNGAINQYTKLWEKWQNDYMKK